MNIDFLGGMPLPQAIDIKTEKNSEREVTRSIEESGKGNDLGLNVEKKTVVGKSGVKNRAKKDKINHDIYDVRGDLSPKKILDDDTDDHQKPVHVIV
ncbi:MAG: hypothetical protein JW932_11725 [Deltaproteobacteria bacterium]|nr:hypothetical protein [Deltaproteobacteria bacterium]